MGMESYSITLLPSDVNIIRKNDYWYLEGCSELLIQDFELLFNKIGAERRGDVIWVMNNCIELIQFSNNKFFQGLEVRGCLSYLEEGIGLCYDLIKFLNDNILKMNIYILNQKVEIETAQDLYNIINNMYKDKITIFNRQYGNIELKITSGEFYKEIKKRRKWYYKIFHK